MVGAKGVDGNQNDVGVGRDLIVGRERNRPYGWARGRRFLGATERAEDEPQAHGELKQGTGRQGRAAPEVVRGEECFRKPIHNSAVPSRFVSSMAALLQEFWILVIPSPAHQHRFGYMKTSRCDFCPETASIECMRNCPRRLVPTHDRQRLVRYLLPVIPARTLALSKQTPQPRAWGFPQGGLITFG